jgi:putative peptidoglycan lipid II flippase
MGRIAAFVVPTVVVYLVLGEQVVTLLFGGGAFGAAETRQVAIVLAAYSLGLLATTQSRLLQSTLYGLDDTTTPARIAAVRVAIATAAGVALMLVLDAYRWGDDGIVRVADTGLASAAARASLDSLHRLGAAGLALGASLGAWIEWVLLRRAVVRRAAIATPDARILRPALASIAIVVAAPLGHVLRSALTTLDTAPVALGAAVTLVPALVLFAITAVLLDLADLPFVTTARRKVAGRDVRRRPRRTR